MSTKGREDGSHNKDDYKNGPEKIKGFFFLDISMNAQEAEYKKGYVGGGSGASLAEGLCYGLVEDSMFSSIKYNQNDNN